MRKQIFIVLLISLAFFSCTQENKVEKEIAKINVDLEIARFDREYARATPADIPTLKKKYPYLFPEQYTDSVWAAKLKDTIQIELFDEVNTGFPDFKEEADNLKQLFQHIKYFFPKVQVPKVVTVTSYVDYNNRIIWADSLLLIALDNYLGAEHRFYAGIQDYISSDFDKDFLVSDVAGEFAKKVVSQPRDRAFLAQMIYHGKVLFLKDKLMPYASDMQKMQYSKEQLDWAQGNEDPIWRNFIENEHLYSTDNKLGRRFLDPAPFSKFGLELDNESPGRIGRYMGWQIVRAFAENNDISLQQLMNLPAEEIFKKSNYKPKQ